MRRRAWLSLAAQVAFVVILVAAAMWQGPRYSSVTHTISDMSAVTAPYAMFLIVILTLCGAATIGFALRAVWSTLRAAFGVASVLTQDPGYTGLFERLVAWTGAAGLAMLEIRILRRTRGTS